MSHRLAGRTALVTGTASGIGRFAQPSDVADLAAFRDRDELTFISGSVHSVEGGASTTRYPDLPAAFARLGESAAE